MSGMPPDQWAVWFGEISAGPCACDADAPCQSHAGVAQELPQARDLILLLATPLAENVFCFLRRDGSDTWCRYCDVRITLPAKVSDVEHAPDCIVPIAQAILEAPK